LSSLTWRRRWHTQRRAGHATFAEEVFGPPNGDHRFLALLADNRELDLAGLNVEDGVGRIALRENPLVLLVFRQSPSFADLGQKHLGNEGRLRRSFQGTTASDRTLTTQRNYPAWANRAVFRCLLSTILGHLTTHGQRRDALSNADPRMHRPPWMRQKR
jgi:hypothetical protein